MEFSLTFYIGEDFYWRWWPHWEKWTDTKWLLLWGNAALSFSFFYYCRTYRSMKKGIRTDPFLDE
jgi:hypothetical protein